MIALFKPTFLKDLSSPPARHRTRIEKLVFDDIPRMANFNTRIDIRKIQGREGYYRIRVGDYRIGCVIETGNRIIFYRVKNRKDIYKVFP